MNVSMLEVFVILACVGTIGSEPRSDDGAIPKYVYMVVCSGLGSDAGASPRKIYMCMLDYTFCLCDTYMCLIGRCVWARSRISSLIEYGWGSISQY